MRIFLFAFYHQNINSLSRQSVSKNAFKALQLCLNNGEMHLYDDHLVIYLKGTDKRITISDHEAGIVEESLTDKGSENEECGPP